MMGKKIEGYDGLETLYLHHEKNFNGTARKHEAKKGGKMGQLMIGKGLPIGFKVAPKST